MHPSTRLFRIRATGLFSAVVIALALSPAAGADGGGWQKDWKNGIGWKSSDGDFSARVGGRLFADFATVSENSALKAGDWDGNGSGVELRQARIQISGTAYGRLAWKGQYDFAGDKVKDVWVSLKDIPLAGTLKIGHFKEPFSLEEMESLRFTTFMERSVAIVSAYLATAASKQRTPPVAVMSLRASPPLAAAGRSTEPGGSSSSHC